MSRPIRQFQIIGLLRAARRGMTAEALAGQLEVSRRTIYRDLAGLQAMGVPIDGAAGVGYVLRPGFDLPPMAFSAEEVEAIRVALALLARTGDAGLAAVAESVAYKLAVGAPAGASGWHAIPEGLDPELLRRAIRGGGCCGSSTSMPVARRLSARCCRWRSPISSMRRCWRAGAGSGARSGISGWTASRASRRQARPLVRSGPG